MLNVDFQRYFVQRMYASIMCMYITERSETDITGQPDPEHAGEHKAVVTTPKELSNYALVCKLWHEELQLHRQKAVATAVAHFIDVVPWQAISLVNVDLFTVADWAGLPRVSAMLFSVHLGSREVFAISIRRTRVEDEDENEAHAHKLSVGCRVYKTTDDNSCSSPDLAIALHALCYKSGQDFTDADVQAYHAWLDATLADVRAWLKGEYEKMTAAV